MSNHRPWDSFSEKKTNLFKYIISKKLPFDKYTGRLVYNQHLLLITSRVSETFNISDLIRK